MNTQPQCTNCPWKKGTDLESIPNYKRRLHIALRETITPELAFGAPLRIMACHKAPTTPCTGWLHHQLINNNIALRIALLGMREPLHLEGEQHASFEDTFGDSP